MHSRSHNKKAPLRAHSPVKKSYSPNHYRLNQVNAALFRESFRQFRKSFSSLSMSYHALLNCVESTQHDPYIDKIINEERNFKTNHNSVSEKLSALESQVQNAKENMMSRRQPLLRHCSKSILRKHEQTPFFLLSKQSITSTQLDKQAIKFSLDTLPTKNMQNMIVNQPKRSTKRSNYYIGRARDSIQKSDKIIVQHIHQSIQAFLRYKLLKVNQGQPPSQQKIILARKPNEKRSKTLIIDLDQTLIHALDQDEQNPQHTIKVPLEQSVFTVRYNIRPYALSFLKKMSKKWQIVIFTASHQAYADAILDEIDPEKTIIDHRLYRQHCEQMVGNIYLKDLRKINRELSQIVIADNSAYSYVMTPDNGIPVLPFYQGKDDQLIKLQQYLNAIWQAQDVRNVNRQHFKLQQYVVYDNPQMLIDQLYRSKQTIF